jgi:hypothetical protein
MGTFGTPIPVTLAVCIPPECKRCLLYRKRVFGLKPTAIAASCSPIIGKVKIKCTFVQALKLCTGSTTHRGSTGIALPYLDNDILRG